MRSILSCIIGLVLLASFGAYAQQGTFIPYVQSITNENGLSSNSVFCVFADADGFIWIGSNGGLDRFDGVSFTHFYTDPLDSTSLSSGYVRDIFQDSKGAIWVSTRHGGLNKYNADENNFTRYVPRRSERIALPRDDIKKTREDSSGFLWVLTTYLGLIRFKPETNEIRYYTQAGNIPLEKATFPAKAISDLCVDARGNVWVTLERSEPPILYKYDRKRETFHPVEDVKVPGYGYTWMAPDKDGTLWLASFYGTLIHYDPVSRATQLYRFPKRESSGYKIRNILLARDGSIWCGDDWGLVHFNRIDGTFSFVPPAQDGKRGLSYPEAWGLTQDQCGNIWIATLGGGVNMFNPRQQELNLDFTSERVGEVNGIMVDSHKRLWVGTWNYGVYIFDKAGNRVYHITERSKYPFKLPSKAVRSIAEDSTGTFWIGTPNGVISVDSRLQSATKEWPNLSSRAGHAIVVDGKNRVWIGTDVGLNLITRRGKKAKVFLHDPNNRFSLPYNVINSLFLDSQDRIWIATAGGASMYDEPNNRFVNYIQRSDRANTITNNFVSAITEDHDHNIWMGTLGGGVNKLDQRTGLFSALTTDDGLCDNRVAGILSDNEGNLWIGTQNGLSCYNRRDSTFHNFYLPDGLANNQISINSMFRDRDGKLFFGGLNGFNSFDPAQISRESPPSKVLLTDFRVFNAHYNLGEDITKVKRIHLTYDLNFFTFRFALMDLTYPEKDMYEYILEGLDKDWIQAGTRHSADYTNVPPGEYVFRVRGRNSHGMWSGQAAGVRIVITPPWWRTTIAYLFYALALLGMAYSAWKLQVRRMQTKHEYQMSKFEAEKLQEIDEMKSRFFTNISHEFRTPLTLILGPVKQLAERIQDEKVKEELTMVHRNAGKLLRLVNELLDISEIESGNMKLDASIIDVVPLLKGLVLSFASHAERKEIQLKFTTSEEKLIACVDREKLERIITNILSNAFKFTPEGGRIDVDVNRCDELLTISVSDTGIGIPREKVPKIFDRFYQVNGTRTREQEGTGIGLALTKELVELHGGKIEVESEEGRGTVFNVSIPVGAGNCEREGLSESTGTVSEAAKLELESAEVVARSGNNDVDFAIDSKKPMLLIVEDNADVRYYLRENLKSCCKVVEAVNGEDGWNKSLEHLPDVIVSDVMMPKMDGFELCRKLKTDERTNHIPVILLTAKASSRDKIEGFETGADEYIMKPFDSEELRARIGNLIAQRERLHEHFRSKGIIELEQVNARPADERFLRKVFGIIEENMSNFSFSVESLAEKASVSRSVLGRKIVSLTGQAPVEIIRRIRLTRAAQLIEGKAGNMSEIAFEVGFTNPAYFSECFKKQFGVSPSQYRRQKV